MDDEGDEPPRGPILVLAPHEGFGEAVAFGRIGERVLHAKAVEQVPDLLACQSVVRCSQYACHLLEGRVRPRILRHCESPAGYRSPRPCRRGLNSGGTGAPQTIDSVSMVAHAGRARAATGKCSPGDERKPGRGSRRVSDALLPMHWKTADVDWAVAAPYITSLLALIGSAIAIWDARRARRETARIDLYRSVEAALTEALRSARDEDGPGPEKGVADALVARRRAAELALTQWDHLLPGTTRDALRAERDLLSESQAYLAGKRMGLVWKGSTEHLVPIENFPLRVSDFAKRVEAAFRTERDRVSANLRAFY